MYNNLSTSIVKTHVALQDSVRHYSTTTYEGKVREGLTVNLVYDWTDGGTPLKAPSPKAH